jgi:hypothetical protein
MTNKECHAHNFQKLKSIDKAIIHIKAKDNGNIKQDDSNFSGLDRDLFL